jgi:hypothetical protein
MPQENLWIALDYNDLKKYLNKNQRNPLIYYSRDITSYEKETTTTLKEMLERIPLQSNRVCAPCPMLAVI